MCESGHKVKKTADQFQKSLGVRMTAKIKTVTVPNLQALQRLLPIPWLRIAWNPRSGLQPVVRHRGSVEMTKMPNLKGHISQWKQLIIPPRAYGTQLPQ
jgi:hypothetical protein